MIRLIRNMIGAARGYGGCLRCHDSWSWKKYHSTHYTETKACFPLCEECWEVLTPHERVFYYDKLVVCWQARGAYMNGEREAIEKAVMEGK